MHVTNLENRTQADLPARAECIWCGRPVELCQPNERRVASAGFCAACEAANVPAEALEFWAELAAAAQAAGAMSDRG